MIKRGLQAAFPLQVRYAEQKKSQTEPKVFVGMIPPGTTEDDLRKLFSSYGELTDVHVMRSPSGEGKGCGFVKFSEYEDALHAIQELNGLKMQNSIVPMIVKFADTPQTKMLKKQQSGGLTQPLALPVGGLYQYPGTIPLISPYGASVTSSFGVGGGAATGGLYNPALQNYATQVAGGGVVLPMGGLTQPGLGLGIQQGGLGIQQGGFGTPFVSPQVQQASGKHVQGPPNANIFIYHIPNTLTDNELTQLFLPYGTVLSAKIFVEKNTGQSKGFGFVSYDNAASAAMAIQAMSGYEIGGKRLKVELKK